MAGPLQWQYAKGAGMPRTLRVTVTPELAVVLTVAILAVVNVVDVRVPHASLGVGPGCAALLLVIARLAGLSWAELGLGPGTWRRGLTWAAVIIGAVALVLAVGAALPLTRDAFRDTRYRLDWEHALLTAFVLIPVGTVLLEEIAFRGVLWGLLRRVRGRRIGPDASRWRVGPEAFATAVSSVLFGLWHILPSLGLAGDNQAITGAVGHGGSAQAITVASTVAFTTVAGVVFCELRRRSGSVLAPAGLHWATNALGVLASAAVWAWGTK
jgi:membrane protease YdiL (CAAX protease family)